MKLSCYIRILQSFQLYTSEEEYERIYTEGIRILFPK